MRPTVSRLAPASLVLAALLLGGAALAAEPAQKPPDTMTVGRIPRTAATPSKLVVTPLKPLAAPRAVAPSPARVKPAAPASTSQPVSPGALNAEQRAKLGRIAAGAPAAPAVTTGKQPDRATKGPAVKGATPRPKAPAAVIAPPADAKGLLGAKARDSSTVSRTPAVPTPAPSAEQLQKRAEPARPGAAARKAAELSTTKPRDASAPKREKAAPPDTTHREDRP